jgi:putative nucleotidyltransferase with HDIG domain
MRQTRGPGGWLAGIVLYPARHIHWKIIAPYVLLTIVLAGVGTYIAARLVTGSLKERFDNQLAESARVASDSVVRRERQHLETVRGVAFTEGVAQAVEQGDSAKLLALVVPLAANSNAQLVQVLGPQGQQLLGMRQSDMQTVQYGALPVEEEQASWAIVQSVLAGTQDDLGDKFAQIAKTADGYALYTAGPIYDGDRLVGVVMVGSLLESFLPIAKGEALADVTIYDFNGAPLATTFADSADPEEAPLAPGDKALAQFAAPAGLKEGKTLFGRGFTLLYGELTVRNQAVGVYSVALPTSFILSAGGATRWQMGLLFAVGMAIVLASGWGLARSLTRPLLRLVGTARAVTAGDLTARSGVHTADEVGVLADSFDQMTERLQRQHLATIRALTAAIDARDPYTAGHSARVGQLAVELGTALGLSESELQHLEIGGYLHDIGKIGVRDSVLLKPGSLTPEERELIERHPRVGLDILASVDLSPEVIAFVGGHHEKLDGSGYPRGEHGERISMIARIAAVADIYDAVTTDRPYRVGMTPAEAVEIIKREAALGKLDQRAVSALEQVLVGWERRRRTDPALKGFRLPERPALERVA